MSRMRRKDEMKTKSKEIQLKALLRWYPVRTADGVIHRSCNAWNDNKKGAYLTCTLVGGFVTERQPVTKMPDGTPLTCIACLAKVPKDAGGRP